MSEIIKNTGIDFQIVINDKESILKMVTDDPEERSLIESIVDSLETYAYNNVKHGNTVSLPLIGCVRRNKLKETLKEERKTFSSKRDAMTKQEYKDYIKKVVGNTKIKIEKEEKGTIKRNKIKRIHKKEYDLRYFKLGKSNAEAFIFSRTILEAVTFDEEIQQAYYRIYNMEKD